MDQSAEQLRLVLPMNNTGLIQNASVLALAAAAHLVPPLHLNVSVETQEHPEASPLNRSSRSDHLTASSAILATTVGQWDVLNDTFASGLLLLSQS